MYVFSSSGMGKIWLVSWWCDVMWGVALWAGLAFARGVCPLGVCFSPRTDATGPVGEDNRGLSVGGGWREGVPRSWCVWSRSGSPPSLTPGRTCDTPNPTPPNPHTPLPPFFLSHLNMNTPHLPNLNLKPQSLKLWQMSSQRTLPSPPRSPPKVQVPKTLGDDLTAEGSGKPCSIAPWPRCRRTLI